MYDVELLESPLANDVHRWFANLMAKVNQYVGIEGNEQMAMHTDTDVETWFEENVRKLELTDKRLIELQHPGTLTAWLCAEVPMYLKWSEEHLYSFARICQKILDERTVGYASREEVKKYIGYVPEEETPEKVEVIKKALHQAEVDLAKRESKFIIVSCKCGYSWKHPCGSLDPKEGRCEHNFRYDPIIGTQGAIVCVNCTLRIYMVQLMEQCQELRALYEPERNTLADKLGSLRDENKELLAENARLRRELERRKK